MYPYIKLLGTRLPIFNLMIGLSLILGFLIYEKQENIFNRDVFIKKNKEIIFLITIISSFIFAALLENFYHRDFSKIGKYGITFYGGILASLLINFILLKCSLDRFLLLINVSTPSLLISHSLGRIGCFFAGCCYGSKTSLIWGIVYLDGEKRVPIQLIESFILFVSYWILIRRINFKNRYLFYFTIYPISRFIIEFFRADDRGYFYGSLLSPSQFISIFLIVMSVLVYLKKTKNKLVNSCN